MCLILLAANAHPQYSLVLAANRDEFYARPSSPAAFWDEAPAVLGGRDLSQGGSWLGINRTGHWCAVTNFRDGRRPAAAGRSRGSVVSDYLKRPQDPYSYAVGLAAAEPMAGYNIILGDATSICHASNRGMPARKLESGIYGLSNHLLDTEWPKVKRGKAALESILHRPQAKMSDALFDLLQDRSVAAEEELPDTGVGAALEKNLSSVFIQTPNYGTRCSTVVLIGIDGTVSFEERSFGEAGEAMPLRRYQFARLSAAASS